MILSKTPREFSIMMRANVERIYDEYERVAVGALMHENAHRSKRPKVSDLFKRPGDEIVEAKKSDVMREKADYTLDWISQFEQFDSVGKEDANE